MTVNTNVVLLLAPTLSAFQEIVFPTTLEPAVTGVIFPYPLGTTSSTDIPVALEGPSLERVNVKVTVLPISGFESLTDFVKLKSAFSKVNNAVSEVISLSHK